MAYEPQIPDPPPTGDTAFDLWLKRAVDEINTFFVKARETGEGIEHDELDRLSVSKGFIYRTKV